MGFPSISSIRKGGGLVKAKISGKFPCIFTEGAIFLLLFCQKKSTIEKNDAESCKSMDLYVCVEPAYRETTWAKETLAGIYAKSARQRYPVNLVEREDLANVPDTVIVVGTTPKWIEETLDVLSDGGKKAVTVSCRSRFARRNVSYVLIDHENATADALRYLRDCKRTRTALFGTAGWSYSDGVKTGYFSPADIFPNEQDLEGAFSAFFASSPARVSPFL